MPALNEFEDDTDREHARLDMHKVNDGHDAYGYVVGQVGSEGGNRACSEADRP